MSPIKKTPLATKSTKKLKIRYETELKHNVTVKPFFKR